MAIIVYKTTTGEEFAMVSGIISQVNTYEDKNNFMTNFRVAAGRSVDEAGQHRHIYVKCRAYRQLNKKYAKYLKDGDTVEVTGQIERSTFIGNDGQEHASVYVHCHTIRVQSFVFKAEKYRRARKLRKQGYEMERMGDDGDLTQQHDTIESVDENSFVDDSDYPF